MARGLPKFPIEGGCQCGSVRYRMKAAPLAIYACHCKDCQRFSGATHTISMVVQAETVELIAGTLHSFDKTADSGRVVRMLGWAGGEFAVCERCDHVYWKGSHHSRLLELVDGVVTRCRTGAS